jgi:hypothetical protein
MFEKGYQFRLIDSRVVNDGFLISFKKFNFKTERRRYVAVVEHYKEEVYIIKYHAACHSKSVHKYNLLFNDEKPAPIIRTCIDIMLDILRQSPNASFGFVGSPSKNKKKLGRTFDEGKPYTQRFRIYERIMADYFGTLTFTHAVNKTNSAYLMINNQKAPIDEFKKYVENEFFRQYPQIGSQESLST